MMNLYWWRFLANYAYAAYWEERRRELPYHGLRESGVFRIKEAK